MGLTECVGACQDVCTVVCEEWDACGGGGGGGSPRWLLNTFLRQEKICGLLFALSATGVIEGLIESVNAQYWQAGMLAALPMSAGQQPGI